MVSRACTTSIDDISLDAVEYARDDWSDDPAPSGVALMAEGSDDAAVTVGAMFTERLRLEPITSDHAHDLWFIHNDDEVARWYGGSKPTAQEALERANAMSYSWLAFGVHKWMAYDRETGELIGRGGPSPTPADDDWGRINAFLPGEAWARDVHGGPHGEIVHANWVEVGWAVRPRFWGQGYATEIGRAGLAYSFNSLGMRAVVSCTDYDNVRSRAVMERLGLRYAGTLQDLGGGADLAVYTLLRR